LIKAKQSKSIPCASNEYGFVEGTNKLIYIDRIYMNLHKQIELIQKNGTEYKGSISKKSIKTPYGTLGHVYVTADLRWFCNAGMPINKPNNLLAYK
jgi:hypothetical protein